MVFELIYDFNGLVLKENIDGPITRSSNDSEKIRILLKLLGKIFHLPPNYIKTGYYIIKEEITKISKNRFKKYFLFIENNYICKNLEKYTLYKRYNRTNDANESYNIAVNRDPMCIKNGNLSKVCEGIKIQEFKISMQILTGKYSSSRSQTTIIKNEKYKELYETFDQSNIFTYLTMF
uniref:LAGLIDADG_2 domain-containing protein n=1 Tax=Strongyloides papillosus TaxID=174720 RepID=A0A0N5BQI0_STREA